MTSLGCSIPAPALFCAVLPAHARSEQELATQLANPVASLISVPLQSNGCSASGRRATGGSTE